MTPFKLLITKKISPALVMYSGLKGIQILEKEFIKISAITNPALAEKLQKLLSGPASVAFTSKNAVTAFAKSISDKTLLPDWKIFCLEGITREEVLKYFTEKNIAGTARNAKSLASVIIQNASDKHIIFFCGNNRRDELPDLLKSNGFKTEEVVVYETELSPIKIVDDFNAVAFFSPSAVQSFFSLNTMDAKVVCFSVGETTTAAIKKYTPNRVITIQKPAEESMIESVTTYLAGRG